MSKAKNVVKLLEGEELARAEDLQRDLLKALKKKSGITVDGSGVLELNGAVLQVLLAAKKSALAKGRELVIVDASPELKRTLSLLELNGIFGL